MLKSLCELNGVSGYEKTVIEYIYDILKDLNYGEAYIDRVGNLIFYIKGSSSERKIMIQAHADEVGFQIINEVERGKYSIKSLGNVKTWNANQQRVISSKGEKAIIYAKDEEQLKAYNYDNLFLIADSYSTAISPGEVFTFDSQLLEMEDCFIGKALDNRASCFCLLETILKCHEMPNDTFFCFSVMEEVNMRGARVLKSTIQPDLCINIDVSAIGDRNSLKMGDGIGITLSNSMSVSSPGCIDKAIKIASENNIRYQLEVSDYGASELVISNELDNGCEELGVSIPCSNLHCANTIVNKSDIQSCLDYLPLLSANI